MPLLLSVLEEKLLATQRYPGSSASDMADRLAGAYRDYARTAQAAGVPPLFRGTERGVLSACLLPVLLSVRAGSLPRLASAFSQGLLVFWTGVSFGSGLFTSLIPSVCKTCIQAGAGRTPPLTFAMQTLARCLHSATKTGIVTFPPPLGPVPLL